METKPLRRKAVAVDQILKLDLLGGRFIQLRKYPGLDSPLAPNNLTTSKVRVLGISFNRHGCTRGAAYLEVQSVQDPLQVGWIRYDADPPKGMQLKIARLDFVEVSKGTGTPDAKCE